MTAPVTPGIATTGAGAPLPLVALPRTAPHRQRRRHPAAQGRRGPRHPHSDAGLDPQRGDWSFLVTIAPGVELPIDYHTGSAEVYTLSGRWEYREYPDQPQIAGTYLYEPAGDVHTFFTPEDNTEDTVTLWWMQGAQVSFNEDDTFHSLTHAVTMQYLTETVAAAQGVGPSATSRAAPRPDRS